MRKLKEVSKQGSKEASQPLRTDVSAKKAALPEAATTRCTTSVVSCELTPKLMSHSYKGERARAQATGALVSIV